MGALFAAEYLGFIASGLTLLTFAQKEMRAMRISAIGANIFFMSYGVLAALYPVLVLHLILLPLNIRRFLQTLPSSRKHLPLVQALHSPVFSSRASGKRGVRLAY